ncbi:MAG: hypothetical protein KDC84_03495 [Crocinitomicaceae bacterium]|nr:hypothetical protein [Crocinitomicaceae bacterium]
MKPKVLLGILIATIWISLSEFIRNEFILKQYWTDHYEGMGLSFPADPINGAVWGIWSLCFAIGIAVLIQKFSLIQTSIIAWFFGFVLMWLVVGNMGVLPFSILIFAIPLSMLEAFLASWICFKMK